MKKLLRLNVGNVLSLAALFVSSAALAVAIAPPSSPEPADYALGFGAASLAFIVWRNVRRARNRNTGS